METTNALVAHPDHAVLWQDERLYLLDQRLLPERTAFITCESVQQTAAAITDMVVRGAPAIGVAAAYGVVLAARARVADAGNHWHERIEADLQQLAAARPTAINLFWAIERMRAFMATLDHLDPVPALLAEAKRIHAEDIAANQRIGELGVALIKAPTAVVTHCNAGALATGGYGTALGVVRSAHAAGKITRVYADETRPWMQGSRLTAWELMESGIPVTLQADGAAASLMAGGEIGWVIVGSDRIAANGDVCNKIGTFGLAILARHFGVKFMVAAPTSTIDLSVASGAEIPIEERASDEVLSCGGKRLAPEGAVARNPVFDVTPAALVDAIVTERGVVEKPDAQKIGALMERDRD
ncbi:MULTISPECIES: S-methyl-5-thioribose-1-phosphate isomerase [Thiorhodovibrio]|uniref:S-methyl-5-thioribose-1-phosphate isomerase n=1 Tax=Thiorhodovibrio TaxID=61593 RepID=UPI001913162B|nr:MULTISPECIES: S-methyl-5-thioribose-1-phosphate isomerase [Thiorhodovibrio]MBK5969879.1 S-methyl-5-thioribose-1-phosphate isomerase [Thiorhodovibrio winogradskyi]WPL12076.1 Methylthioribose-1-phosphate isomerase [Thiorhodovibrio litoralis]